MHPRTQKTITRQGTFFILFLGTLLPTACSRSYKPTEMAGNFVGEKGDGSSWNVQLTENGINDGNGVGTYEIKNGEIVGKIFLYTLVFKIHDKDTIECALSNDATYQGVILKRHLPITENREILKRLSDVRLALLHYSGDMQGHMPSDPNVLVPKYLQRIEAISLSHHQATSEVEIYGIEVCPGAKDVVPLPSKLKDTGKWGYVADPKAACSGLFFVDCTHRSREGKEISTY